MNNMIVNCALCYFKILVSAATWCGFSSELCQSRASYGNR